MPSFYVPSERENMLTTELPYAINDKTLPQLQRCYNREERHSRTDTWVVPSEDSE